MRAFAIIHDFDDPDAFIGLVLDFFRKCRARHLGYSHRAHFGSPFHPLRRGQFVMGSTSDIEHFHHEDHFRESNFAGSLAFMQIAPFEERTAQSLDLLPKGDHLCNATLTSALCEVRQQSLVRHRWQCIEQAQQIVPRNSLSCRRPQIKFQGESRVHYERRDTHPISGNDREVALVEIRGRCGK